MFDKLNISDDEKKSLTDLKDMSNQASDLISEFEEEKDSSNEGSENNSTLGVILNAVNDTVTQIDKILNVGKGSDDFNATLLEIKEEMQKNNEKIIVLGGEDKDINKTSGTGAGASQGLFDSNMKMGNKRNKNRSRNF